MTVTTASASDAARPREYCFARTWRPGALVSWTLAAAVLLGSWLAPATRVVWDALDAWFFFALNATVAWGEVAAAFWAVTGDRRFDIFAAIVVFVVYMQHISRGDEARLRHGLAFGAATSAVLLIVIALQRELIAMPRMSPSGVLEPFHSIVDVIPWSRAKEISRTSFPGDHATVMMIITALWWRGDGRRIGVAMALLGVVFVAPRMAAGAHWLTDAIVGGGFVALLTLALVEGTPFGWWLYRAARWGVETTLDAWTAADDLFSPPGSHRTHPRRQMLRGMCIGMADLVPGVSGGTMALILGVYRRLLAAIAHVDGQLFALLARGRLVEALRRVDVIFLLPLGVGVVVALVIFSRVIPLPVLLAELPEMMFGLFFGLIAASIVHLLGNVHPERPLQFGWLALGVVAGLAVVNLVPVQTPSDMWFLFLCGMIAILAMLIPGVSGAFVLLILGKYADAIDALGRVDLAFLLPLLGGAVVGAIVFSRAVTWLLDRYYRPAMLTVIGILGGSILAVWPFQDRDYELVGGKLRLVSSHAYVPGTLDVGEMLGLAAIVVGIVLFRWLARLAAEAQTERERP